MPKIKIDKELFEKVKTYAEQSGYTNADEFVTHLLEQVVDASLEDDLDDDVAGRLKGLGYIS